MLSKTTDHNSDCPDINSDSVMGTRAKNNTKLDHTDNNRSNSISLLNSGTNNSSITNSNISAVVDSSNSHVTCESNNASDGHTPLLSTDSQDLDNIENMDDFSKLDDSIDSNSNQLRNELRETLVDERISPSDDDTMIMETINEPTAPMTDYQKLLRLRREYQNIMSCPIVPGMDAYYIDNQWYKTFLEGEFDPDTFELIMLGEMKTLHEEIHFTKADKENFIPIHQFQFLFDNFGLENGNMLINRKYVHNTSRDNIFLDLHPVKVIPHILCNNPSQVNRYTSVANKGIVILFYKESSTIDLKNTVMEYFGINPNSIKSRIWLFEYDQVTVPTVIIPSTSHHILKKKMLSKKGKKVKSAIHVQDREVHILLEIRQPDIPYFFDIEDHVLPGNGLVGLNNLGNTCYMNSALQCLMHIPELNSYFLYRYYEKELNKDNPLGNGGKVAVSFGNLIGQMFDNRYSGKQSSYSPRDFKYTIGHFNSLFADYHQQDSQEFIAYLLDGLHEDLNRVMKKPYVEKPELEDGKENDFTAIKELANNCWDAHKLRNNSAIVDLFVAQYKSTLKCPSCDSVSITFDPYNDLTLPLPIKSKWTHKIKVLSNDCSPQVLEIELPKSAVYTDLKNEVSKYTQIPVNELIGVEILRSAIYKNFEDSSSDARYLPLSELITKGDDIWFYQLEISENSSIFPVFSTVATDRNQRTNFALPFFISLTDEERKSYGKIHKKMMEKYALLSTSKFFSYYSQKPTETFKKSDFEDIEFLTKTSNDDYEIKRMEDLDDDCSSVISLANPNVSLDDNFNTLVLDESNDKSYFNRYRYNLHNSHNLDDNSKSLFWYPKNDSSITKDGLPSLKEKLDFMKKCFYLYTPSNADLAKQDCFRRDKERLEAEAELEAEVIEIEDNNSDVNMGNGDDLFDKVDLKPGENNDLPLNKSESPESETYFTCFESTTNINDASKLAVDDQTMQLSPCPIPQLKDTIGSLDGSSDSASASASAPESFEDKHVVTSPSYLIEPNMAFVNEFDEQWFNVLFCESGDEEEMFGRELWTNPEPIRNEELEESKRINAENAKKPVTLYDCLYLFSTPEVLGQNDLWYCPKCKEHRQATKKIELWSAPDILTIHLKRFESTRSFSDKIDIVVDFPIEGLDITKHVADQEGEHVYDLFAVDNHYGGLGGGHYTAYVKGDNEWHYFDDSRVTQVNDARDSIRGSAYLLFYRKRSSTALGGEFFEKMMNEVKSKVEELVKNIEQPDDCKAATSESEEEVINEEKLGNTDDACKRRKLVPTAEDADEVDM